MKTKKQKGYLYNPMDLHNALITGMGIYDFSIIEEIAVIRTDDNRSGEFLITVTLLDDTII